ncbi:MAG TPA: hypothetical protein VGJ22_04165 [Anaerolineales bacterium]
MKRWQGSCIGGILVLLLGGGSLLFLVPMGGAMIAASPPLFDRITAFTLCPEAVEYSYEDYGSAPINSTNPSGGTGHYTQLTCTLKDGSKEVFSNEEVGIKGLAASFGLAAAVGAAVVLVLAVLGAIMAATLGS